MRRISLNPLGWALVGVAALLLVAGLAVFAVGTFSSTRIDGDARTDRRAAYTWSGGPLILEGVQRNRQVSCTVTPQVGATVEVQLARQAPGSRVRRYDELAPWFTGTASVTCTGDARAWSGSAASLYKLVHSAAFRLGGPLLVAVPLVAAFAAGRRRQPAG